MVAQVIINSIAKDLDNAFDYIIPKQLEEVAVIGAKVLVPFGYKKDKEIEGYIIGIVQDSNFAKKEIIAVEEIVLSKENIDFAKLMAKRYFCTEYEAIRLMLPPAVAKTKKGQVGAQLSKQQNIKRDKPHKLTDEQQNVYDAINGAGEYLIFGVTGSRKNRNIFAVNRKSIKRK